ncbi:MAG: 4Fe-4S binding protein, partial [Proteobacteria bacterium]|nr:4Fe-4S binding protein [Pseudomonadota bacterium]
MTTFQPFDIIRKSASVTSTPEAKRQVEVAKLIDTSKCIGCKACQSACIEWNDTHPPIGTNVGVY